MTLGKKKFGRTHRIVIIKEKDGIPYGVSACGKKFSSNEMKTEGKVDCPQCK